MVDPLSEFNWPSIYSNYDRLCKRFDGQSEFLQHLKDSPKSDRELYYQLRKDFAEERTSLGYITPKTYKSMLYWKLYSQPAAIANILKREIDDNDLEIRLKGIVSKLLLIISRNVNEVINLLSLKEFAIRGMKDKNSLPVRTTFLHFIYPEIVPIFDKMVLQAVGITEKNANHNVNALKLYLPHAWDLADKYKNQFKEEWPESSIRIIDMALWITRA